MSGSPIVDAFISAAAAADPKRAEALRRQIDDAGLVPDDRTLVTRALTAAARAASKAVGEAPRESLITNSDVAFAELQRFRPAVSDPQIQRIMEQLAAAFELATDHLGPIPGGRLGSVKSPGGEPRAVEAVGPDTGMMVELAHRAGAVVGAAGAAGITDSVAEVVALITGCPICGAPVSATGGSHQQITPSQGPVIQSGRCEAGHQLNRNAGETETTGCWRLVENGDVWSSA